jgi:hypothetical protein
MADSEQPESDYHDSQNLRMMGTYILLFYLGEHSANCIRAQYGNAERWVAASESGLNSVMNVSNTSLRSIIVREVPRTDTGMPFYNLGMLY